MNGDDEIVRDPELENQTRRELLLRQWKPPRPYIPAVSSTLPEANVPMGRYAGATEMPRTPAAAGAGPAAPADWPGAAGAPPEILQPQTGAMPRIATPRLTKPEAPVGTEQDLLNQIQDMRYKREHPMGTLGTPSGYSGVGGKVLHVLGKIGNIAGQAVVPNLMPNIPGTDIYNREKEANLRNALERFRTEASTADWRSAEAERARAEARLAGKPKPATGERSTWYPDESDQDQRQWDLYDYPTGKNWVPLGSDPSSFDPAVVGPSYPGIGPARGMPTTGAAPERPGTIPGITQFPPTPGGTQGPPTPLAPPAVAAGTAQRPTGTYGVPKPSVAADRDKFLKLWNKTGRTPDEENYVQSHLPEFESIVPVGQARADQMMGEIRAMPGIDPGLYAIGAGATYKDAKDLQAAARQASELNRQTQAPYVAEKIKDRHTYGYAEDPKGTLEYTNKAQADEWGSQFSEISKADVYKDRVAMGQLNDIVQNTQRYENAVRKLPRSISTIHSQNMATILNEDKIKTGTTMGWLGRFDVPGGDFIADVLKDTDKAHLWNDGLTKEERDVLSAYIRAKSSAIMYQRAAGAITRLPGDLMKLELDNLPAPYVGWTASEPRFRDWNENVDQVTKRFPHNLPGVEHPTALRERLAAPGTTTAPGTAPGTPPPTTPAPQKKGQWNAKKGVYE